MTIDFFSSDVANYLGTLALNLRLTAEAAERLRKSPARHDLSPGGIVRLESDVVAIRTRIDGLLNGPKKEVPV